jgi:hypothetical protein
VQISQVLHNRRPTEITDKLLFIYHVRNVGLLKRWKVSRRGESSSDLEATNSRCSIFFHCVLQKHGRQGVVGEASAARVSPRLRQGAVWIFLGELITLLHPWAGQQSAFLSLLRRLDGAREQLHMNG